MTALAADGSTSSPKSDQLMRKIRPGLLALKQFEPVYVLARWIRNFFMDILNRPESSSSTEIPRNHDQIETSDDHDGQPITPESVLNAPTENTAAHTSTPMSAAQSDYSTQNLAVEDSNYMFGNGTHEDVCPSVEPTWGAGGFWPTSLMTATFPNNNNGGVMDFPQPDSLQYQAMYFLADLGMASSECP